MCYHKAMSLEPTAVERTCNTIRRQVQDEFPDLTIHFIVYKGNGIEKAIETKRGEFLNHPAGELFFPALKKAAKSGVPAHGFCGLAWQREKKLLPFLARRKALSCFFVQTDAFEDEDILRQHVYSLLWHTLNILFSDDYKKAHETSGFIPPDSDHTTSAWKNMLADAFSALVLEIQGKKGAVRHLARRRSNAALETSAYFNADDHPFPVIVDATMLVLNEMRGDAMDRDGMFSQAFAMSQEIGVTFDQNTVLQWWAFSKPAQEMAWLGFEKSRILGAAIHSSEDPYARSTAYMVAEALNMDPSPASGAPFFNPFTDAEANDRHHYKLCDDIFQNTLSKMTSVSDTKVMRREAARNNNKIIAGQLIGWCGPALLAVADTAERAPEGEDINLRYLKKIYDDSCAQINSETLSRIAQIIIALKRQGKPVSFETLAEGAKENEALGFIDFLSLETPDDAK